MGKYDGVNTVEAQVSESNNIAMRQSKKEGWHISGVFMRIIVSAIIVAVMFGLNLMGNSNTKKASDTVVSAMRYDIRDLQENSESRTYGFNEKIQEFWEKLVASFKK